MEGLIDSRKRIILKWDDDQLDKLLASPLFGAVQHLTHSINKLGEQVMGNKEALVEVTEAINAAVVALDDLAAKAVAGVDISAELSTLSANLKAAVAKDDPPAPVA